MENWLAIFSWSFFFCLFVHWSVSFYGLSKGESGRLAGLFQFVLHYFSVSPSVCPIIQLQWRGKKKTGWPYCPLLVSFQWRVQKSLFLLVHLSVCLPLFFWRFQAVYPLLPLPTCTRLGWLCSHIKPRSRQTKSVITKIEIKHSSFVYLFVLQLRSGHSQNSAKVRGLN